MHKSLVFVVVAAALVFGGGCEKKIDASSAESLKKSSDEVANSIGDEARKEKFQQAMVTLMGKKVLWSGGGGGEAGMNAKMKETFDGKTADEIIAEGEKAQAESKAEIEKMMRE